MRSVNITEKVVEDILTTDISIMASILSVNQNDLSLISRQKRFDNLRIMDMLYLYRNELLLIELKAVPFYIEVINQINDYYKELVHLQQQAKLINTRINKIILVTEANQTQVDLCRANDIKLIKYDLEDILTKYYNDFKELSAFFNISPQARGVSSLKLLKAQLIKVKEEFNFFKEKAHTNRDKLAVAHLLGLVDIAKKRGSYYSLSEFGEKLLSLGSDVDFETFNDSQYALLADFVKDNPFYSQVTFSIMSVVDTIFVLSKAEYPVQYSVFQDFFIRSLGKDKTWQTEQAKKLGTQHFISYAKELGFIHKIGNYMYLTPFGINALLTFQLNRTIKLINARR